jgi:hypothetical protein
MMKSILAAAALCATMGANAQVAGSLGGGFGTFLDLSAAGLNSGSVATLSGGTVLFADQPFADIPKNVVIGGFLAAGPSTGSPATLSFTGAGVDYISFLWGSPDTYNLLTVTTTGGVTTQFSTSSLSFAVSNGDQTFSQYVQFSGTGGAKITGLTFNNIPSINAFESANFSVTTPPIPEPGTYALLLAGLGVVGFMARRRKSV